jgi:hypothetical protein
MKETHDDGFDEVIASFAKNIPEIKIGSTTFKVVPASKRIDETAITVARAYFKATMEAAEADDDKYVAEDNADAKATSQLRKFYGFRFDTMRDYRAFMKASMARLEFRAILCITNGDGTLYAIDYAKTSKVLKAFEANPALFEEVNTLAGWPEFDAAAKAKAEAAAKKDGEKTSIEVVGDETPNE